MTDYDTIYAYTKAGVAVTDKHLADLIAEGWPETRGGGRPPKLQTQQKRDDTAATMRKKYRRDHQAWRLRRAEYLDRKQQTA